MSLPVSCSMPSCMIVIHAMLIQIVNGETFSTAATLSDCLECLVSITGSGSRSASAAVLGAGGLEAATKALAAAAGSTSVGSKKVTDAAPPPGLATAGLEGMAGGAGSGAAAADGPLAQAEALHAAMLAVRLVALLLEYGAVSKTTVLSEYTDVLQHTVAALGMLVGHPSVLAQQQQGGSGGAAAAAAVGMAGSAAASAAGGHGAVGGAGAGVAGLSVAGVQGEDAAMLQLEALHALLLVLPLPQELELHHRLAGAVHRQEWPAAVRRGLNWLLRRCAWAASGAISNFAPTGKHICNGHRSALCVEAAAGTHDSNCMSASAFLPCVDPSLCPCASCPQPHLRRSEALCAAAGGGNGGAGRACLAACTRRAAARGVPAGDIGLGCRLLGVVITQEYECHLAPMDAWRLP